MLPFRLELVAAGLRHGGVIAFICLLTLSRLPDLVRHPGQTVPSDLIDPVYNIWATALADHNAHTWSDGLWSLFDANILYPTPHAAAYGDTFIGLLPLSALLPNPVIGNQSRA